MATVNLNPDGTASNNWDVSAGDTAHEALADSDTGTYIRTANQSKECILTLDDFTESHSAITRLRHAVSGFVFNTRSDSVDIQVKIENAAGVDLFSETETLNFNSYVAEDHFGTWRTQDLTGGVWTQSTLNGLRLSMNTSIEDPPGISKVTIVKAWLEVQYSTGYGNDVLGIASANIGKINGIANADIDKVNGA